MNPTMFLKFKLIPAVFCFLAMPLIAGASSVYEAHLPVDRTYNSLCEANYHGIVYCNLTDPFSVSENQTIDFISWFDLGCMSFQNLGANFYYTLADAETYEVIAETPQAAYVECQFSEPVARGEEFTLAIAPAQLEADRQYLVLLSAAEVFDVVAYWGVDADLGSSFRVGSSLSLENLQQVDAVTENPLAKGETSSASEIIFSGLAESQSGNDLRLQVEIRSFGDGFSGEATAVGNFVAPGQVVSVSIPEIPDGAYEWRARIEDSSGILSEWLDFDSGNTPDFLVFEGASPEILPIPNPSCDAPVYFTSHVPARLAAANFWTSCYGAGNCRVSAVSLVMDSSGSEILAESDYLTWGFEYTANAYDVNYRTVFSSDNQILLEPGTVYSFINAEADGNHCTPGPYHPNSAYLELLPIDWSPSPDPEPPMVGDERVPVIIIPGIMGSYLENVDDGKEAWPNIRETVFSIRDEHLRDLGLRSDGSQEIGKNLRPTGVVEKESVSILGVDFERAPYGYLFDEFRDRGYVDGFDLFGLAYDWRMSLSQETQRLETMVALARQSSPNGRVNFIAHSMGGLLLKSYLSSLSDSSFVDKVVLAGVPQLGAPMMFKALNYGDNLGFEFPLINKDILSADRVKDITQNMPGAYQLLPSSNYVDLAGGYIRDFRLGRSGAALSYEETADLMTADAEDSRNSEMLSAAKEFHENLDEWSFANLEVYRLMACDNPTTLGEIRLYDGGHIDIAGVNGDGTVPLISSLGLGGGHEDYFVSFRDSAVNHSRLTSSAKITDFMADIILGLDLELPDGVSLSSSICFPDSFEPKPLTFRISSHSPVSLHLYDGEGNHVGQTGDGGLDLEIEGSSYQRIEDNSFIFVPAGEDYRILADADSAGKFTLKLAVMDGFEIINSINYIDVPLVGPESASELTLSPNTSPQLFLDLDGNSVADEIIMPTSQLTGLDVEDIMPPDILVDGLPSGSLPPGFDFEVNFSVLDSGSGVASVVATFNGLAFESGDILRTVENSSNFLKIEASDMAGNPSVFSSSIQIISATETEEENQSNPDSETVKASTSANSRNGTKIAQKKTTPQNLATSSIVGEVLGLSTERACLVAPSLTLGRGRQNDSEQVKLLQSFLNGEFGLDIPLTGFFGPITELAVKAFQLKYYSDILAPWSLAQPTGFVGEYTLKKLAFLGCGVNSTTLVI